MNRLAVLLLCLPAIANAELLYGAIVGERLEYHERSDSTVWDVEAWYGGDYRKLYLKTEGERRESAVDHAELHVLYSRAWSAYFDMQLGLRRRRIDDIYATDAVVGVQGDLPYAIDTSATVFVSEDADVSIRAEFERDVFLGERLILQPRIELELALQDIPELRVESGLHDAKIELRLRYEATRRFAPYLGIAWEESRDGTTATIGLRFAL